MHFLCTQQSKSLAALESGITRVQALREELGATRKCLDEAQQSMQTVCVARWLRHQGSDDVFMRATEPPPLCLIPFAGIRQTTQDSQLLAKEYADQLDRAHELQMKLKNTKEVCGYNLIECKTFE